MDPLFQLNSLYNEQMAKRPDAVAWPDRPHRVRALLRRAARLVHRPRRRTRAAIQQHPAIHAR